MCGRYQLGIRAEMSEHGPSMPEAPLRRRFQQMFALDVEPEPRWNIAPTQTVLAIRRCGDGHEAVQLRWGLLPFWAKDRKEGAKMTNARAETVATKPAFRAAFKARRCVIPATSFYEWEKTTPKQPWRILLRSREPFAIAGLWESWVDKATGEIVETCAIVTTEANGLLRPLHDRMPVILPTPAIDRWLDADAKREELEGLLVPFDAGAMERYRIARVVNSAGNETAECVAPLEWPV